jgi:hypothetical protein
MLRGPQAVAAVTISADRNPAERVLEMLRMNPHLAFSPQETAITLGLKTSRTPLILSNLARSHKAEKIADGKYRAVNSQPMSAVL